VGKNYITKGRKNIKEGRKYTEESKKEDKGRNKGRNGTQEREEGTGTGTYAYTLMTTAARNEFCRHDRNGPRKREALTRSKTVTPYRTTDHCRRGGVRMR
jgi:hypothetical protein